MTFGRRTFVKITCEAVAPRAENPSEGMLVFNIESRALFSRNAQSTTPRLLERILRKSRAVDRDSLCIKSGFLVWEVKVSIFIVEDDGNVIDAACIAALAALKHFRRPEVTVDGDSVKIVRTFWHEDRSLIRVYMFCVCVCV